jgi:hypothetical protein
VGRIAYPARRLVLPAALSVGLVFTLAAGAQTGSGRIAYESQLGVWTVNPDGSGDTLLRQGAAEPIWSPDGSQIAYVAYQPERLVVANADGTGEHTVTTGSVHLGSWSPDGARLAYVLDGTKIDTANTTGGDERQLSFDGGAKGSPVWSPDGLRIAYSSWVQQQPVQVELFVVGADGTGLTQLTHAPPDKPDDNVNPAWSPDGSWIAFARAPWAQQQSISIVHPDGSALHRVADDGHLETGGQPAWSPDGAKIAFTNDVNGAVAGEHVGREIFVVDADGTNEQRLTELGPKVVEDGDPTWSHDGVLLLFARSGKLATMNADGTCEGVIGEHAESYAPSWQAVPGGAGLQPKRCHAASVDVGVRTDHGLRPPRASITATVKNEGTEPLSNVELLVTFSHNVDLKARGSCQVTAFRARCPIGRLERGQSRLVPFEGLPRVTGLHQTSAPVPSKVTFKVVAQEQLLPTFRERAGGTLAATRCSTADPGSGVISGSRFDDRICGRRGADRIFPGAGRDRVDAGAGPDAIVAADGYRDRISCGPGRDTATVDRKDRVARDCERVRRTR